MKIAKMLSGLFKKESNKEENSEVEEVIPELDKKFKIVIDKVQDQYYYEMIDWLNLNTKGNVDIKPFGNKVRIGFEEMDDALYFRIKYGN